MPEPDDVRSPHEGMVSLEETRRHYGVWRWRLEQASSMRLVNHWQRAGSSHIDADSRVALVNVAWALAALERSWAVLLDDAVRMERIRQEGAPAVMVLLSGPYSNSLHYLLGMSLWVDLGDVLVSYRTVVERFGMLTGSTRRGYLMPFKAEVEAELQWLKGRSIPALARESLPKLANRVLHESWHPGSGDVMAFKIYWKGAEGAAQTVDFAEGPAMNELEGVVQDTVSRMVQFFNTVLPA